MTSTHTLYSYRRCPYAMRARMALTSAGINCDVVDIDFKDKPAEMLALSPKGTVPVLKTARNEIVDESLDVMQWALGQNDPQNWLNSNLEVTEKLILENDGSFKAALDKYKYASRFSKQEGTEARDAALIFLRKLEAILTDSANLTGNAISYADIAIFPFVRQFANVDRTWFNHLDLPALQAWLTKHIESDLFTQVFKKREGATYALLS